MKLVNTLYDLEFDLIENQILVLSIENHLVYSNILETFGNSIREKMEISFYPMKARN